MADAHTTDARLTDEPKGAHDTLATEQPERADARLAKQLMFRLGWVAFAVMPISVGLARVLFGEKSLFVPGAIYLVIGVLIGIGALLALFRTLRKLPPSPDDCESYGRHLVGLTYLLLVIGLANAVGTSTLAFDGGLGFSAAAVIEASDPKHAEKADEAHAKAKSDLKLSARRVEAAERAEKRARDTVARACAKPPVEHGSDLVSCEVARTALITAEEAAIKERFSHADAKEVVAIAEATCANVRTGSKQALFFLLSLSTMMALFGASFYVVNSVRAKRPRRSQPAGGSNDGSQEEGGPDSTMPSSDDTFAARAPQSPTATATTTTDVKATTPTTQARSEDFDVHAFWSGAFFRVGEAVLFTFAFFWLIWTSNRRTEIIWLPVLALFVGMFVKTGEAIIFRLGMRVLSAVESLLPAVPARPPSTPASASTPSRSEPLGGTPAPAKAR